MYKPTGCTCCSKVYRIAIGDRARVSRRTWHVERHKFEKKRTWRVAHNRAAARISLIACISPGDSRLWRRDTANGSSVERHGRALPWDSRVFHMYSMTYSHKAEVVTPRAEVATLTKLFLLANIGVICMRDGSRKGRRGDGKNNQSAESRTTAT